MSKTGFYSEKTRTWENKMSRTKTGFYFEKGIDVKNWCRLFSSFLLKLKIYELQCMNLPTGNTATLKKKHPINFTA